jgi:hypothetical protein
MAQILSIFKPASTPHGDWSRQEIAEFYRVEAALVQAGLRIAVDRGVTDEGDPWFVFCRASDGEVIVHFARIGFNYIVIAESVGRPLEGPDFRKLLSEFVSLNPTLVPTSSSRGSKLLLHPASLLAAVVATALYHLSGTEAVANTVAPNAVPAAQNDAGGDASRPISVTEDASVDRMSLERHISAATAAMFALAATEFSYQVQSPTSGSILTGSDSVSSHIATYHSVVADAPHPTDVLIASDVSDLVSGAGLDQWLGSYLQSKGSASLNEPSAGFLSAVIALQDATSGELGTDIGRHAPNADTLNFAFDDSGASFGHSVIEPLFFGAVSHKADGASLPVVTKDIAAPVSSVPRVIPGSDLQVVSQSDSQAVSAHLIFELGLTQRAVSQVTVADGLSVRDVIALGANEILGSDKGTALSTIHLTTGTSGDQATTSSTTSSTATTTSSLTATVGATADTPETSGSLLSTSGTAQHTSTADTGLHYEAFTASTYQVINTFARENDFEVIRSGPNIVLFDTNAEDFAKPDFVVKTWEMADGSTISIVGDLPHYMATTLV